MSRTSPLRAVAAALAVLSLAVAVLPNSALGAGRYRSRSEKVAPGMTLIRLVDTRGPNRIKVLKVDPRSNLTLDVALATDVLPGHETTSSMAARHNALAAINGDYTIRPYTEGSGRPVDTFAEDGVLKASPLIWGRNFSISRDEQTVEIAHSELSVNLTQHDTGELWEINSVNGLRPEPNALSLYTPDGGQGFKPPGASCAARLFPYGTSAWASGQMGLADDYYVSRMRCSNKPMPRKGGSVVSAPVGSDASLLIRSHLIENEIVTMTWSLGRRGVLDTIGGNPNLVEKGAIAANLQCSDSYFCYRNPRTGIGVDAKGMLLLVTVDGRRAKSVGMTPGQFAELFRYLGATWALNLDGGGSTTMVVRGRVVNNVSDPYERPVGSAILVLQGPDPGEAEPIPQPSPSPSGILGPLTTGLDDVPRTFQQRSFCLAGDDPASTGGMLDALARGELGPHDRVPRVLRPTLREFRSQSGC